MKCSNLGKETHNIDKTDLLKRLCYKRFEHFQALGLPPSKCNQLVAEKMTSWKNMSEEELEKALNTDDPPVISI